MAVTGALGADPPMDTKEVSAIRIRDPFVLPVAAEKRYYLYGTTYRDPAGAKTGFDCWRSGDLKTWEGPFPAFRAPADFWGNGDYWAPEVYARDGGCFMFATFKGGKGFRGTQVLRAEKPEGPFVPWSDGPVTPKHWECLDGTLHLDVAGEPWMVFCHEWTQVGDGGMWAVRLAKDWRSAVGRPVFLFNASAAPWALPLTLDLPRPFPAYVTDGPFLHYTAAGDLFMLWSSIGAKGYAIGVAKSANGRVDGEWVQQAEPLWADDGGHAMLFRKFDGQLLVTFHAPNTRGKTERAVFYRLVEANGTLKLVTQWCP
jgi:beta-xylosidase